MPEASPLPVTERTRHRRLREQGSTDRRDLADIVDSGIWIGMAITPPGGGAGHPEVDDPAPHRPGRQLTGLADLG